MTRGTFLVMAAGGSTRMGSPKALLEFDGATLVERAVATVRAAGAQPLVVVGAHAEEVSNAVDCDVCRNPNWRDGLGSSVARGVAHASTAPWIGVLAVDQPGIDAPHLRRLQASLPGADAAATLIDAEILGIPAIFSPRLYGPLSELTHDRGARDMLRSGEWNVVGVDGADARDVDTPAAWQLYLEETRESD